MSTSQSSTPVRFEAAAFSYAEWRQQFLNLILRGATIVGLIVAIVASIDTELVLVAVYAVSYLTILFVTFVPLPYRVRALGFLAVILAVAIVSLLQTGIRVDARLFLLAFVVMAAMLFGVRAGIIAIGISFVPAFIIGYFILTGQYTILSTTVGGNTEVLTWIVAVLVLVLVETLILTGLAVLQRGFDTALQQSQQLFEAVQVERATLEQRVDERTAQIRTSAEVGQAAAATLDSDQLLQKVVNLITERFGFYYVAVFTLNDTGTTAVLREATGEAGRILKERTHQLEVNEKSMVGYAISQRRARIALDVGADPVRFANPLLPDTRSEIALPLIAGSRVLGALDVQSTHAAAFDEASAVVLQAMADQIAVALNNAEQFKQTELQAKRQSNLNQFSRGLFSTASMEDLYRVLATALPGIVPHDYLSLMLTQGATLREYRLQAAGDQVLVEGPVYSPQNTLSGRAYTTRRPAISRDLTQETDLDDLAQLARLDYRSALSLPLNIGERILGTLNFASHRAEAFTLDSPGWYEQLAGQIGAALETQRLAQAQQTSLREMEALTRQLSGQAWAKRRYRRAAEAVYYARSGLDLDLPASTPEIETAIKQRAPLARSRPDKRSIYHAALAVPIVLRGEVLGGLQVGEAHQAREWTEDDLTFMQAVADQVALALDNARLIEETQQRAERERLVADISSRMFAANELESIVQIASEELGRVLQVKQTTVKVRAEPSGESLQSDNGQLPKQHA
jgi:GAF domain-containing protein